MKSVLSGFRFVLLATLLMTPLPARAVEIVVGGFRYDILFLTDSATIPDNIALVRAQPWYTGSPLPADRVLAQTFAQAYLAQAGTAPFNLDTGAVAFDELLFIYDDEPTIVGAAQIDDRGVFSASVSFGFAPDPLVHYAYVSGAPVPVAVPEIDGNVLAKALFTLFALWLWLTVRRARRGAAG